MSKQEAQAAIEEMERTGCYTYKGVDFRVMVTRHDAYTPFDACARGWDEHAEVQATYPTLEIEIDWLDEDGEDQSDCLDAGCKLDDPEFILSCLHEILDMWVTP